MRLDGKVAIVTGASRGLGRAIAKQLAEAGAAVAINFHTDVDGAKRTYDEISRSDGRAEIFRADVATAEQVDAMVDEVNKRWGGVDILVANAGYSEVGTLFDLTPAQWDRMVSVVLSGVFYCARAVVPSMKARGGGRIITISSDAGKRGGSRTGLHYSAAKGGVLGLMKGMARQLAPFHINVNDVCPCSIKTERWAVRFSSEQLEQMRKEVPLGRLGIPEDVAFAVMFLASDEAKHITGASIDVSGGAFIH